MAVRSELFPNSGYEEDILAFCASNLASAIARFGTGMFARGMYQAGLIQGLPFKSLSVDLSSRLSELVRSEIRKRRELFSCVEPSQEFVAPFSLRPCIQPDDSWNLQSLIGRDLDALVATDFGLNSLEFAELELDLKEAVQARARSTAQDEDEDEEEGSVSMVDSSPSALKRDLVSYLAGISFGRWDIRYATGEQVAPEMADPFAPLPVCPPGQLQNTQGLPARPEDVPAAYPVRIPWDGILVDDPNHPLDLERRVREVIEIIWSGKDGGPTAEAIEHEACEILGVKSLRDYFRKQAGFFADHLKRYSKSRRQAPIYWPLSTASGSYTLWIYYHRLTPDTLFKCLQQFVEPKIREVEQELTRLRAMDAADEGGRKTRDQLAQAEELRDELLAFRDELAAWAPRWKPNLNDGVLITASPLWKLYRLPKWRKDLEACWKKLEAGDYDWAHLAYTLWPARVREKCKTDRSLAIAHGLEDLCQVQPFAPKKKRAAKKAAIAKASDSDNLL